MVDARPPARSGDGPHFPFVKKGSVPGFRSAPLSLDARLLLMLLAGVGTTLAIVVLTLLFDLPRLPLLLLGGVLGVGTGLALVRPWQRRLNSNLDALFTGLLNLQDKDYSVGIHVEGDDEVAALAKAFNAVADQLRAERQNLHQRELLLDTVLQSSPTAMLLLDQRDRVLFANPAARQLLNKGRALAGMALPMLLPQMPAPLAEALSGSRDGLFTLPVGEEAQVWNLSRSRFHLNGQDHRLFLFEQLTRELARAEVATWKKVIRLLSHELNNSLAPIASMANSGLLLKPGSDPALLAQIFTTIRERADHLGRFLQGYARFARLPAPQVEPLEWQVLVDELMPLVPFTLAATPPRRQGWADPAQLQQMLLNLLKNAHEAGSRAQEITLAIRAHPGWDELEVADRGGGMSEDVLGQALLPFYSTKRDGTGLGLALCREIVDAHDGRIRLANREGGGLAVTLWLPNPMAL
jgi:two-component system nitrogen regulation sensor histidine kinase NtrY